MGKAQKSTPVLESELQDIVAKGDELMDALSRGSGAAADAVKRKWSDSTAAIRGRAGKYAEAVSEFGSSAYQRGERAVERGGEYVRDYPVRSVVAVALVAYVLGALSSKRR